MRVTGTHLPTPSAWTTEATANDEGLERTPRSGAPGAPLTCCSCALASSPCNWSRRMLCSSCLDHWPNSRFGPHFPASVMNSSRAVSNGALRLQT
ncbi:hypothetical protein PsYK624_155740 [Phanerochaete sordida]|uniref:Uncharacterized protein n=1 Tax=Phanerochaete sordida TaxID=48140 RepID=A0A9P3GPI3_9APHY|nr:hypothetical protein PsYK624_155740 [Phanerochaete sordida]